jgi:ABC-type arginine/histidine transport system permease subunit
MKDFCTQSTGFFHTSKLKFCTPQTALNTPLPSVLLPVSINLTILETSHKWNHTVSVFLCLTSFNVSKVHPCCTICYFVLFNQTPFSNYLALVYVSGHKLNCEHPESQSQKRKAQIYYSALVSYKGSTKFITYTVFSLLSYFHDGQLPLGQTF